MGFQKEYRYPLLFKSSLYTTSLLPILVPVFSNRKKSGEDLWFYKNKEEEQAFMFVLWEPVQRELTPPVARVTQPSSLRGNHTSASQHEVAITASELPLDLFCASVSKMCPKITAPSLLCHFCLRKVSQECSTFEQLGKPTPELRSENLIQSRISSLTSHMIRERNFTSLCVVFLDSQILKIGELYVIPNYSKLFLLFGIRILGNPKKRSSIIYLLMDELKRTYDVLICLK